LYRRPLSVAWSALNLDFSPGYGQDLGIRERYNVTIAASGDNLPIYANINRFLPVQNVGSWQILYKDDFGEYYVEKSGSCECPTGKPNQTEWTFTLGYDWTYRLFRAKNDFFGAFLSVVKNCNADLEPGAVPNGFIDRDNVLDYARIVAKIYGKDPIGAIEDALDLLSPTIAGYRFPDKELFTALSQLPVIDLNSYLLQTAIGDLGLWVHPYFEVVDCQHTIEVRHYGKVPKLTNQLSPPACAYPQTLNFQGADCEGKYNRFLAETPNTYRTYAEALASWESVNLANGYPPGTYDPAQYVRTGSISFAGCPDKQYSSWSNEV
jgi:hypothetical protein